MNNLRDSVGIEQIFRSPLPGKCAFLLFLCFEIHDAGGESGVLCFMHISLRIYFLVLVIWHPSHEHLFCNRTPKALIARDHSKTSRKLKSAQSFEIQIRYQKGSLSDPWLFLQWKLKKSLPSFIQTWFEQFRFSCRIWEVKVINRLWPTKWVSKVVQRPVCTKD